MHCRNMPKGIFRRAACWFCYQYYMPKGISNVCAKLVTFYIVCLATFPVKKYSLGQRKRHIPISRFRIQLPAATCYDDILLSIHRIGACRSVARGW